MKRLPILSWLMNGAVSPEEFMPASTTPLPPRREIAFLLSDVARLLRTVTDQRAAEFGTTRARWAVLVRIQRHEGLNQNELASLLDVQPITLGRLVDKLCEEGLVEREDLPEPPAVRMSVRAAAGTPSAAVRAVNAAVRTAMQR